MAVRRISDLPNLYSYYEDADLSNGLMEVSYADPSQPRRYVSFHANVGEVFDRELAILSNYATKTDLSKYVLKTTVQHLSSSSIYDNSTQIPDGNAIYDYIEAQDFLTPEDLEGLGIGDIKDFVNQIDSLLNRNDLHLFVAQWGVNYDDLFDSNGKMRYDIALTTNNYKTPIWKYTGDSSSLNDIRDKYYNAQEYDMIFFKTINDAVKFSQRFKFLEGAGVRILICTDLIQPLSCVYSVDSNAVHFDSVTAIGQIIDHSDSCIFSLYGAKVNSVNIKTNADHEVTQYQINYGFEYRRIFSRWKTYVNAKYQNMIRVSDQDVNYNYLMFDYGSLESRSPDTFVSYAVNHLNNSRSGVFNRCAFMHTSVGVLGSNISLAAASFSNCETGFNIYGGSRSMLNGFMDFLSCTQTFNILEGGTGLRDSGINSYMYVKNGNMLGVDSAGILKFNANMVFVNPVTNAKISQYSIYEPTAFARLSSENKNGVITYGISSYVSYDEMSTLLSTLKDNPSTLSTFVPTTNLTIKATSDGIFYKELSTSYQEFLSGFTGLTKPLNDNMNSYYDGTFNHAGFISFRYDKVSQCVTAKSKLFDNYETDMQNPNSRLRQWMTLFNKNGLADLWDHASYKSSYSNTNHFVSYYLSDDNFVVTYNNSTHNTYLYSTYVTNTDSTGNKIPYSFEGIAGVSNTSNPIVSASLNAFAEISAKMCLYGYRFLKK